MILKDRRLVKINEIKPSEHLSKKDIIGCNETRSGISPKMVQIEKMQLDLFMTGLMHM
jgi:hypothetical protein